MEPETEGYAERMMFERLDARRVVQGAKIAMVWKPIDRLLESREKRSSRDLHSFFIANATILCCSVNP